jgi:hypothetical protein
MRHAQNARKAHRPPGGLAPRRAQEQALKSLLAIEAERVDRYKLSPAGAVAEGREQALRGEFVSGEETRFERLQRQEEAVRQRIKGFRAENRLSRDELHDREL